MTKSTEQTKRAVIETAQSVGDNESSQTLRYGTLQLGCINGEALEIRLEMLTPEIVTQAALHGLKQKLVDAAAISRNPDTGKAASPDDKWAAVKAVYDRLTGAGGVAPSWNAQRGEGGGAGQGLLFRALCRMYAAKTPDQIREFLDGKSDAEKAALRKNPKVAALIVEIQAESAKTGAVDTDALLDELESSPPHRRADD